VLLTQGDNAVNINTNINISYDSGSVGENNTINKGMHEGSLSMETD
jgi:hypothetical protein